ncbi:MAG: hypothetical protein KDB07_01375 [Planctomycetes bacterium]|nr:hypothetical protein [Planctomycetota bacterium]
MNRSVLASLVVGAALVGGVLSPMVFGESERVEAQDSDKKSTMPKTGMTERIMDAKEIRARIAEIKLQVKDGDESLDQLNLRAELKRLEDEIAKNGDNAKVYVYSDDGDAWKPRLNFDASSFESSLALRALPESFKIFETRDGGKLILLDTRTGDTWTHTFVEGRGNYWEPLPRAAERYHLVPRNYHAESGFKEGQIEHRHRREQIIEMMEELNRELEEMKSYEKR